MWIAFDLLTRIVIGGSLLLAGLTKLLSTVAWRQVWLASYRLLPRRAVRPAALLLPSAEVCCGLAMLTGTLGAGSALAGAVMLAVLAAAVAAALVRGMEISCHCLTMTGEVISWRGVTRNLVLMVAAVVVAWHGHGASGGSWRGGAELLGGSGLGWAAQLAIAAVAATAAHLAALAARLGRRQRALAAISLRQPASAAQAVAAGQRGWR